MRPGVTWMIVGAVAVIVVFAGLDAVRSSGDEPPPAEATTTDAASATTQSGTGAVLASSAELQTRRVVGLMPGRVTTNERFPLALTFTVPPGWYGSQDETGFVLGMGIVGEEVDLVPGGVTVHVLDFAFADAVRKLEQVEGIRLSSPIRMAGSPGRIFASRVGLTRDVTLNDLGVPVVVPLSPELILLGAGRETLLIQRAQTTEAGRAQVNGVLKSFRVTTHEQEIEQMGNEWARLFGAGRRCPGFMGQPACEWVDCERPGGRPIQNCTPVSSEVQRSFAGATVEEVVIRGQRAAARFSNGETVGFVAAAAPGRFWWIARVGAGRQFFE